MIASGTETSGACTFTWQEARVYECESSWSEVNPSETAFADDRSPSCAVGAGHWVTIRYYTSADCEAGEVPTMDIMAVLIVVVLVIAGALGWIAGQQR